MNRAAAIEQLKQTREMLDKLLTLLESGQGCEHACKSDKQIERCVISSFRVAESMGFKGELRHWQELLRIGD